jgi:hypothetical protein
VARRAFAADRDQSGREDLPAQDVPCTNEINIRGVAHDAQLARQALAEYFSILREWSLNSRPDDVLAPDSNRDQP